MRILTRKQVMKRHRELWNKVAELLEESHELSEGHSSIVSYKRDALVQLGYEECEMPKECCWLCEYDFSPKFKNVPKCENCLIGDWGNGAEHCCRDGSLYQAVITRIKLGEYKKASELARQIANLPERTDDE